MTRTANIENISRELFVQPDSDVYAIVDAASWPDILDLFEETPPKEYCCLITGDLSQEELATAPFLVKLSTSDDFTDRLLFGSWGNRATIFAFAPKDAFREIRKHFRNLLQVRKFDGEPLFFRYYDPGVFRVYLPTCDAGEMDTVFGPIEKFFMESENPLKALLFFKGTEKPKWSELSLAEN